MLDSYIHQLYLTFQVEEGNTGTEFVELVYYCVNKCQTANASFCCTFAAYLNKIAEYYKQVFFCQGFLVFTFLFMQLLSIFLHSTLTKVVWQVMTPINSILRLYAAGLLLVSCNLRSRAGDLVSSGSAKFKCLLGALLENEKIIQSSPPLLGSLHICSKSNCMSSSVEDQHLDSHACTRSASDCEASITYLSSYVEALKFLCQPLAKSVNSARKQLVTEKDDAFAMTMLSTVEDTFHVLCQLILSSPRYIQ